ncbi:Hypothetical_protein [Hexamita inflata]|uniref:Hypothetical_protein n=1 Tax=Hexamita inflata TaxID=28002 RepID=A0ABP1IK80_9EUKA
MYQAFPKTQEEIYKRKQVMRDEENNLSEIRNVNLTNNCFAELVSDDIQIKEKSEHQAILEYLKEQQKLQKPMQKADKAKKKRKPDDPSESPIQSETVLDPSRQIRTKFYFHSRLPYRRRFKWNQECPTKQQQHKSSPNNKTYKLPSKEKQHHIFKLFRDDIQTQKMRQMIKWTQMVLLLFMTNIVHYIYSLLIQTQLHATPLLNQKLLSTKRSPKQTPLARKSQRRVCEEV